LSLICLLNLVCV